MKILEQFISIIIYQTLTLIFDSTANLVIVWVNSLYMYISIDTCNANYYLITIFIRFQLTFRVWFILRFSLSKYKVLGILIHINNTIGKAFL